MSFHSYHPSALCNQGKVTCERVMRRKCLGSGDPPGLQNRRSSLTGDGVFDSHALPPATCAFACSPRLRSPRTRLQCGSRRQTAPGMKIRHGFGSLCALPIIHSRAGDLESGLSLPDSGSGVMPKSVPVDARLPMVVLPIEPVILQRINPRETLTLHIAGKRTTVKSPLA